MDPLWWAVFRRRQPRTNIVYVVDAQMRTGRTILEAHLWTVEPYFSIYLTLIDALYTQFSYKASSRRLESIPTPQHMLLTWSALNQILIPTWNTEKRTLTKPRRKFQGLAGLNPLWVILLFEPEIGESRKISRYCIPQHSRDNQLSVIVNMKKTHIPFKMMRHFHTARLCFLCRVIKPLQKFIVM